jgi:hypothetical protein
VVAVLSRLSRPLLRLGNLAFDCEVSIQRGGQREVSERRLAAGATVSDHSRRPPRIYRVSGAVSVLPQLQNLGRPGATVDATTFAGLPIVGALVPLEVVDRLQDFETRLTALQEDGVFSELELIDQVVGRKRVVLTDWTSTNTPESGQAATYDLTLREVQRAGLTIADATPEALALSGTGGAPVPGGGGPSQATPGTLDVVP